MLYRRGHRKEVLLMNTCAMTSFSRKTVSPISPVTFFQTNSVVQLMLFIKPSFDKHLPNNNHVKSLLFLNQSIQYVGVTV